MKKVAFIMFFLVIVSITTHAEKSNPSTQPVNFDGVWKTNYGLMRLIQTDTGIEGIYDPSSNSLIQGSLEKNRFNFTYKEARAEGEGWFQLNEKGNRFTGEWRAKGDSQWSKWEGSRVLPTPGLKWLVVVEARWEDSFADKEYSFGEMLKSFFAGTEKVQVRQRYFTDAKSFTQWVQQTAYIPEPVVLSIASHGSAEGVLVGEQNINGEQISRALHYAANLELLHFSACLMMKGKVPEVIQKQITKAVRFPISGYTTSVDWSLSAVIEFLYFDMILSREMKPQLAAQNLLELIPIAGTKTVKDVSFYPAGFAILEPST